MPTIRQLATKIASIHDIDPRAAVDVVQVHADQLRDDPDLYDPNTATLTPDGAEVITEAVRASYEIGAVSSAAQDLLDAIAAKSAELDRETTRITAERDALIREAMRTELRRDDIAAAAGFNNRSRLYQIRNAK